jgi:hypothetical protein
MPGPVAIRLRFGLFVAPLPKGGLDDIPGCPDRGVDNAPGGFDWHGDEGTTGTANQHGGTCDDKPGLKRE